MQNLAWESQPENKKEEKKLMYYLQKLILEKPDSVIRVCSLICVCIFMALLEIEIDLKAYDEMVRIVFSQNSDFFSYK